MKWELHQQYLSCFKDNQQTLLEYFDKEIAAFDFSGKEEHLEKEIDAYCNLYCKITAIHDFYNLSISIDNTNEEFRSLLQVSEKMISVLLNKRAFLVDFLRQTNHEVSSKYRGFINEIKRESKYGSHILKAINTLSVTGGKAWRLFHITRLNQTQKDCGLSIAKLQSTVRNSNFNEATMAFNNINEVASRAAKDAIYALNNIKGEALSIAQLLGYDTVLSYELEKNRISREMFDRYQKASSELIPQAFYQLNKIINKQKYRLFELQRSEIACSTSIEFDDMLTLLKNSLNKYSEEFVELIDYYKNNSLIDNEPREGKRSGACMAAVHELKKCFVLLNDTSGLRGFVSLAHEFGHVFHHTCMFKHPILETNSPMVINECVSKLFELMVLNSRNVVDAFSKEAIDELKLKGLIQTIGQVGARFKFEKAFFELRKTGPLSIEQTQQLMLESQVSSLENNLEEDGYASFEWVYMPHYYYTDISYYNYPYIIGYLTAILIYLRIENGQLSFAKFTNVLVESGRLDSFSSFLKCLGISEDIESELAKITIDAIL